MWQGDQSNIVLYRLVNNRERYYIIRLFCNLFGEYIVIRRYGASRNTKHSREIVEVFVNKKEACIAMNALMASKLNKGYAPMRHLISI